jgi:hypothetical protein
MREFDENLVECQFAKYPVYIKTFSTTENLVNVNDRTRSNNALIPRYAEVPFQEPGSKYIYDCDHVIKKEREEFFHSRSV